MKHHATLASLQALVGEDIGCSDWLSIDQARIDLFAQATGDDQWIHTDPGRAAAGPFGATVAHGYLTLSLLPLLFASAFDIGDVKLGVNYGLNRVRFMAPVKVGSRLRGHFRLLAYTPLEGGAQLTVQARIEIEGNDKPACVAETVSRRYL
ncbi:MAG: MaoC family dehydratase [Rubrivivax sp.]|nr:MaoC family dehydratase [Rubrivivax sp.]